MRHISKGGRKNNKLFLFAVFFVVVLLLGIVLLSGVKAEATTYATSVTGALGEIWNSTQSKFDQKASLALYEKLGGSNVTGTTFQDKFNSLKSWAGTARTSLDFRNNNSGANVVVTLGGKQWVATYLTQSGSNLVLTLMLADKATNQSKFNTFLADSVYTYPSDSYGSSYVRASLISGDSTKLNSTSDTNPVASYANTAGTSTLTAITATTALGTEFASFTSGALSSYILSPAQVGYQATEGISITAQYDNFPYSTSNDAYGAVGNTNFHGANSAYNYYTNTTAKTETYVRWKDDKIWIPSITELGTTDNTGGIWKTNRDLRSVSVATYMTRSSGYSSYRGYYIISNGNGSSDASCFKDTTITGYVRPAIHLNLSATAATTSSGIAKPTKPDNDTFKYNNENQTYNPKGFDSATMTISDNTYKDVKIKEDGEPHEADPDGYEVAVSVKSGYNWFDGTTDDVKFNFVIQKADPVITVGTNPATLPNPLYESYGLPTLTVSGTPGTIKWDDNQTASASITNYNWTFTPDDLDNFEVKKDKMALTYTGKTATGIKVVVKDGKDIYDKYDTFTYATFADYIKSCISVYEVYNDGTSSTNPLPDASYSVDTVANDILVSAAADSETKKIDVEVTADGVLNGKVAFVNATVNKAKIEDMRVTPKASAQPLKYPVTIEQIKANYDVQLMWNFDNTRRIQANGNFVSVAVVETSDNPGGVIKAGSIDLKFTYQDGDRTATKTVTGCTIQKGDIDMSGVSFSNKSEMYDGTAKSIQVDIAGGGNLPTGVTGVTYSSSGDNTSVGTHTITATFTVDDNYNSVDAMTATLTITNSGWNMSGVTFENDTLTYDGQPHTLTISGTLPDPRIEVTYTVADQSDTSFTKAGTYVFTASFSNPDPANYADIPDMTATLTINKDTVDMSGISFENDTLTYDGDSHTIAISGTLPAGVTVNYSVTGQSGTSFTNAGTYQFIASFTVSDADNFNAIADMTATLTINKATIDMSGVSFEDKTITADGNTAYTLTVSGTLPTGVTVNYSVAGQTDTSFKNPGTYEFTASFTIADADNFEAIPNMTATLTVEADPNAIVNPPEPQKEGFIDKLKKFFADLIEKNFPLWQIITMSVSGLLAIIFTIKAIQYGNRKKKAKGEAKKIRSKAYSALLPIFSTDIVLAGLSNQAWTIIAFAMLGIALLTFIVALVMRKGWKKAELAIETAVEDREERKHREAKEEREAEKEADRRERREIKELREQIALMSSQHVAQNQDSVIEAMRREMEAQRREEEARRRADEERHRQELDALREEQSKRDEAMKLMLANMMGRQQMDAMQIDYASVDDTDLLVQKVIAGLLPVVQQMVPEPTAYLAAPDYANDENYKNMANTLQQQNAQIAELQSRIENMSNVRVDAELLPDQSEELHALNAKLEAMQRKMDQMAYVSADEYDDEDFDDEEEWDSILDEEEEDNFVESVVIEEDGTVRKISPNFRMRLKESSDKNREWYAVIKNMFCSQRGVTYRVCKRVEKIRYQGQVIGVIGVAKRSIKLWLALKPYEYDARRYHHKDVSDKPRFVDVPMYVRVGSDRALERAQELILALFQELNMEERKRYNDRDIQELIFTLKHNRLLTNKQNKALLRETVHVHDCDVLDDEIATKCIESKNTDSIDDSVMATVKLDDIDVNFLDGNRVTLEKLKKAGLVSAECTGFTVTAGKRLTKPLIIVANDFTLPAVKMIVLTGGRAIKLAQVAQQ